MPNYVVRINEVGDCVQKVIDDLNTKLAAMNKRGHFIEMPEELEFQMTVLDKWEILQSTEKEISNGEDTQGGYSTDTETGSTSVHQTGTETRISDGTNAHVNNGTETTVIKQA